MSEGRIDAVKDLFEAHRLSGLFRLAHTIATMCNTAAFREGEQVKAKDIYDQLVGDSTEDDGPCDWVVEDGIARKVPREQS